MKSSQDNVSSDETTKTQQKLKQTKKPSKLNSKQQDLQAVIESETPSAITKHKKTPSDSEEVVDDDNELSSEGAQSQVV